jgi:hypothetical protein
LVNEYLHCPTYPEIFGGGDYLLIYNLGDGTGILRKRGVILSGRPAFWLKDYIDRRFMRRFQALE